DAESLHGVPQCPTPPCALQDTQPVVISLQQQPVGKVQGPHPPGAPKIGDQLGPIVLHNKGPVVVSTKNRPVYQLQVPDLSLRPLDEPIIPRVVQATVEQSLVGAQVHVAFMVQGRID